MKNLFRTKNRNGISPLLATVILIGITLAAGGAVFTIWNGSSTATSASNLMSIENVQAIKGSNHADFTITVKNTGTAPWKNLEIWVGKEAGSRPILYEELHEVARGDNTANVDNPLRVEAIARLADGTPAGIGRKFVMATTDVETLPKSRSVTAYPTAQVTDLTTLDGKFSGTPVDCKTTDGSGTLDGFQCTVFTGKQLSSVIAPGQTMRVYADVLLPNMFSSTDTAVFSSSSNNPNLNPITDLQVGDELVVNVKAVTTDNQEIQMQSVVRLTGV